MRHSLSKYTAFNGETTPRHTFLCSDLQCLPPGKSPITGKSFIVNKVSMKRQRDPFEMGILAKMAEMANNHQVDK